MATIEAWHFLGDDGCWSRGKRTKGHYFRPKEGVWYKRDPDRLRLCIYGLHASVKPLDALRYAPGSRVCRVLLGGKIIYGDDKVVASRRKILWSIDATQVLRKFARMCALDVVHLWDAPDVVLEYLKTGKEELREAAYNAARSAAREAASAAWSASYAASDAARYAAWSASYAASYAARAKQNTLLESLLLEAYNDSQST